MVIVILVFLYLDQSYTIHGYNRLYDLLPKHRLKHYSSLYGHHGLCPLVVSWSEWSETHITNFSIVGLLFILLRSK